MHELTLLPLEQACIGLLALTLSVCGPMALNYFVKCFNLHLSATQMAAFDGALDKALQFGVMRSMDAIKANGWDHVDTQNDVLATAANYAVAKFPDALKSAGISPNLDDPVAKQHLADALRRALPAAFTIAAASPATPPAPAPAPIAVIQTPYKLAA